MKYESGTHQQLASISGSHVLMPKLTVCTIPKNNVAIKTANKVRGVTSKRSYVTEEMEKLLLVEINDKQLAGYIIS